ncbi:MAG TPA: hypothetical protein VGG25_31180 [Streptosporangiaceae bacterium]|jgi:hypothetical protein
MATTLQARVAARGFPVFDVSGQSGQGTLPDSTLPSGQSPGDPTATWTDPNTDPASVPATLAAPEEYVLGQMAWGLPGAANPDDTPGTHAAPFADPTLPVGEYFAEADAAHADEFDGWKLRRAPATLARMQFGQQTAAGSPAGPLQPLTGQIRSNAGFDGVQGYGGGADGVNGTNATMPLTVNDIQFPGSLYYPFVNAAEVPFLDAIPDQFIAAAPELPPFTGVYDAPNSAVLAQDPVTGDTPATGPAVADASSGALLPLWGT